jgi:glycogen(starch) synthase
MFGWEFPPFNSGGLGVACLGLTRALTERGADVIFVMPRKLDIKSPWARIVFADENGMSIHAVNSALKPYITSSQYPKEHDGIYSSDLLQEVMRYAAAGAAIAKQEQFDIIYAHDWLSFGAGIEAKRATGKPLIVHVHATEFDRCGGGSGINRDVYELEKRGMEEADQVIAVSELTKKIIVDEYGIPEGKVRVVYNGIDETTAPSGSAELPRLRTLKAQGYAIVLFLGRLTLQKGPDYFIRAAKRVLDHNPKVIFVLSGSGDMEHSALELAARLGIADRVLFTGFLQGPERHEMYMTADLFIMPSVSEPFGITSLEAMRLGTPTIISKQSGVAEIVRHALKVDFWDVDEMANKILAVVGFHGLRQTLSANAISEAEHITWAQAAERVDGIVHELTHN